MVSGAFCVQSTVILVVFVPFGGGVVVYFDFETRSHSELEHLMAVSSLKLTMGCKYP